MRDHFDLRLAVLVRIGFRNFLVLVLVGPDFTAAVIRMAVPDIWPQPASLVQLARRGFVAHAVDLVIGEPERSIPGVERVTDRVPDADRDNFAFECARETVEPDHAANAELVVKRVLVRTGHVEGLPQADIELVVGADRANPRGVVIGLLVGRNQFALGDDRDRDRIRAFHEKLGGREPQYAVTLGDIKVAVSGVAGAIGYIEADGRCELLDGIRNVIHVPVGRLPYPVLARADPDRALVPADRHMPGVGRHCEKLDLEPGRHLDVRQDILADVGGKLRILLYDFAARPSGTFKIAEFIDVLLVPGRVNTLAGQCKQKSR